MEIDQEWFDSFFCAVDEDQILRRRESSSIEFKEQFCWDNKEYKSKIAQSAAAFSNHKGGVIFFGIANKPHKIIGVETFEDIDDASISTFFNEHFSPHIEFERRLFDYKGIKIGVLHILESRYKPIICIKDSAKTADSDIYFRYSARSSKIKSGDLNYLIQEIKRFETEKWMGVIQKIASIGVEKVGVLNSASGELYSKNNKFIIDESIMDKINFLDKYSEDSEGAAAVRIIGDVVETRAVIEKAKPIYEEDIFAAFLTGKSYASGKELIEAILRQNTEYYPIYYFLNIETVAKDERKYYIQNIVTRSKVKKSVLNRIDEDIKLESKYRSFSLSGRKWGEVRKMFLDALIAKEDIVVQTPDDFKLLLEATFSLSTEVIDEKYIKNILYNGFTKFYPFEKDSANYVFRWAITFLDLILYK